MAEEQKTGCSPSDCAGCSHAGECGSKPQSLIKPENKKSHINHVIAVVSGKGGVGKSMVTACKADERTGIFCRYHGRRYHRSIHSEDVWNP